MACHDPVIGLDTLVGIFEELEGKATGRVHLLVYQGQIQSLQRVQQPPFSGFQYLPVMQVLRNRNIRDGLVERTGKAIVRFCICVDHPVAGLVLVTILAHLVVFMGKIAVELIPGLFEGRHLNEFG